MDGPARFDGGRIVIVGGGVVGLSIAYHLAERGHSDVVVVERGLLAEGATAKATGGIRQQFSSTTNARISREAVEYFTHFQDLVGEPFAFRQHGYLFVTRSERVLAAARAAVSMQRSLKIPAHTLSALDVAQLHPHVRTGDLVGGTYCPTDGSGSPADVAQAFARQSRRRGVIIRQRTEFLGTECWPDGNLKMVRTSAGEIESEILIIAAGPWSGLAAQLVGLEVPLRPTLRQACAIAPVAWMSADLPFTVDLDSGAYLHPESAGGIIGGTDRDREPGFDQTIDDASIERLILAITHRFPGLSDARIARRWSGFREMTPDDHALVGPIEAISWLWLAIGFSGHGFMHSPIIGREISRWLLTGSTGIDITELDPGRFSSDEVINERLVF